MKEMMKVGLYGGLAVGLIEPRQPEVLEALAVRAERKQRVIQSNGVES